MPDFQALHRQLMERGNFRPFLEAEGLTIRPEPPDANGLLRADGCRFTGTTILVDPQTGGWVEPSSERQGRIYDFVVLQRGLAPNDLQGALRILCQFNGIQFDPEAPAAPSGPVPEVEVKALASTLNGTAHQRFMDATGLNKETLAKYDVGWLRAQGQSRPGDWSVPVRERDGTVRGIRLINENLVGRWAKRLGKQRLDITPRLMGLDEFSREGWSTVLIVSSEIDRLLIMQERSDSTYGALCVIEGRSNSLEQLFSGQDVVIAYPADNVSLSMAQSVVGPALYGLLKGGKIASLKRLQIPSAGTPDDRCMYHWFKRGGNWTNLIAQIGFTKPYVLPGVEAPDSDPVVLSSFTELDDEKHAGRKVRLRLSVVAESNQVYSSPTRFQVENEGCEYIKKGACLACQDAIFDVTQRRPETHLEVCGSNTQQVDRILQNICCDRKCRPRIKKLEFASFRELVVMPYAERRVERDQPGPDGNLMPGTASYDGRVTRVADKRVIYRLPTGQCRPIEPRGYWATGRVLSNPKTQFKSMLIETLEPIPDEYEVFDYAQHMTELRYLSDLGWKGICDDLALHRTRLHGADDLLLVTLLTYCSPLNFQFNGEQIRGWLTAIVLGDTGVGKTVTFEVVSDMVKIGDIFSSQTGRRTGLSYATVRTGEKWGIQAGMMPLNTRRVMLVEEAQELREEDRANIAEAMDRGVMAVNTVASASFETKTRIVFNCNPPYGRTLDSYNFGVLALKDLFKPSFLRRIDLAAVLKKSEDNSTYNRPVDTVSDVKVSPKLLRELIFFAWTLTPDRVVLETHATEYVLSQAMRMVDKFGSPDDITLVYPADFRKTLARLAAAWAVLDLSSGDDFKTIVVRRKHVDYACGLLDRLYSSPSSGLDRYSEACKRQRTLVDYGILQSEFTKRLDPASTKALAGQSDFGKLCFVLTRGIPMSRRDLCRMLPCKEDWLGEQIAFFVQHGIVKSDEVTKHIVITAKWIGFLKRFEAEADTVLAAGVIHAAGRLMEGNQRA